MAVSKNGGKSKGLSRWATDRVQPVNSGKNANIGGGMHKGTGNIGSLSQLTRQASHGSTQKSGMAKKLASGTGKTGSQPFPSMARGPLRADARRGTRS